MIIENFTKFIWEELTYSEIYFCFAILLQNALKALDFLGVDDSSSHMIDLDSIPTNNVGVRVPASQIPPANYASPRAPSPPPPLPTEAPPSIYDTPSRKYAPAVVQQSQPE